MDKINKEEIQKYLSQCGEGTKIYLGCDSECFPVKNEWYCDYMLCVVIHINGNNGGKVFGEVQRERAYDKNFRKPTIRLMNEVIKVAQLYLDIEEVICDYEVEVHLDLNPSKNHTSNIIVQEALGYIKGVCMIEPKIKPEAWAASSCADRYKSLKVA